MELIVRVDQWESFYMEYPDRGLSNREAGTLFGAVQIMHERVSVYLPELMYRREAILLEHHEKLSCHMNAKGVLDIYTIDHKFLMNLEVLIRHLSCPVFPDSCNPA
ncbi:hypothetical protein [Taibaiella helva]|uniref:hypothetical protein n=1 Tax=Taibaiella helva TaxID=2301235 RepID=UPI001300350E|nr:hypothetical protein [Taibaiella helva]